MSKNIIFYFSGTGNSLKVAKDIAEQLGDCKLITMAKPYTVKENYDRMGFVYPVYCGGMPGIVKKFIQKLNIEKNRKAYFYAISTGGGMAGGLSDISKILENKGSKLSYADNIMCYPNYVCLYPMKSDVEKRKNMQAKATKQIIMDIKNKTLKKAPKNSILAVYNTRFVKSSRTKDKNYKINASCNGCGICSKVCPVDNIEMKDGKPVFLHHCEQCVACIQWCKKQAINYKNKTQSRGRYHHPDITVKEIVQASKG